MRGPAMILALLLLSARASALDLDLSGIVKKVNRRTAAKLLRIAKDADREDLAATARRFYEAAVEFDPANASALTKLGYRRYRGEWRRDEKLSGEIAALEDADPRAGEAYLLRLADLRDEHIKEVVRVCVKYGTLEQRRPIIEALLARMPRRADLHEALGHVRIGRNHVRPGLVDLVKWMPLRLRAWRNPEIHPVPPAECTPSVEVPGVESGLTFYRVGSSNVATTLDTGVGIAASVQRTRALLRLLLGERAKCWSPSTVLFLQPAPYNALVKRLQPEKRAFEFYQRFGNYEHHDFYAIRVWQEADAAERYAHTAGYLSMYLLGAPPARDAKDERDTFAYAWLLEGFGYLLSLELFDRAHVSFVSIEESSRKRTGSRPPPKSRTRAACLAWIRQELLAGATYPLRDVFSFSLNNLDFCASMQACTFLRFLFLYDPEGAKNLPRALAAYRDGPSYTRVDLALRESFDKGINRLEPLWRAFVLEIDDE